LELAKAFFFLPLVVCLFFTYFFGLENVVYGHSVPDKYSLAPDSLLQSPDAFPENITILFSERPDPKVSYIHVTDSEGNRIDYGDFKITGEKERQATVFLNRSKVNDGVYSVSWLTLSKDDGHISKGTYVVGVGGLADLNPARENTIERPESLTPIVAVIKTPIIISQVCILGFVMSHVLIWRGVPGTGLRTTIYDLILSRFRKPIIFASVAVAVATTLLLIIQTFDITDSESDYLKNLGSLFYETSNGITWLIRIICSAVVLLVIYIYSRLTNADSKTDELRDKIHRRGMVLLGFLVVAISASVATNSIVSHSASIESVPQVAIISDFIHFAAVSIWVGGLVYLSYVFFPSINRISSSISGKVQQIIAEPGSITLLILSRFSTVASVSLGVIGITGLYLAWLHIHSIEDLLASDYGKVLMVKLSIALPVLFLGAYHQFWIRRIFDKLSIRSDKQVENHKKLVNEKVLSSIKSTVTFEAILAICILSAAAFLTVTPLPTYVDHGDIQNISNGNMSSPNVQAEFAQKLENQGVPITLTISPFHVGFNNFTVRIPMETQNLSQISNVYIEFKKSDDSLGPIIAKLQTKDQGAYSTIGGYLSQPGDWDLKATIQRIAAYDLNYRLTATLNKTAPLTDEHMNMDSNKSENPDAPNRSSYFSYLFIFLSIVVATLSALFYVQAKKSMTAIQKYLGSEK